MAQIRTLKLNLLADVTKFGAGMAAAGGDIRKLDTATQRSAQRIKAAFAGVGVAAGYMALRIGKEAVTAAVEDEKSQKILAKTLQNTTKATNEQIASTEKWITKTQFATGVSDSKLRPALGNLARATGDLTQAQKLSTLALDISAATSKDVETVSLALAKAYNGNVGALTKLGIPLDENIKKTKDFNAVQEVLYKTFGGAASTAAQTYSGQLAIVNQRIDELKESAGTQLLPVLGRIISTVNDVAVGFSGGTNSLAESMSAVTREGYYSPSGGENLGSALRNVSDAMGKLFNTINGEGKTASINLNTIANALNAIAGAIERINKAWEKSKSGNWLDRLKVAIPLGGFGSAARVVGNLGGRAAGGTVSAGKAYTVGEFGRETFIPNTSGRIVPNAGGGSVVINLNGIIDAESARRSIERLLQDSGRRTAAVNLVGSSL